ncbi:hypothetical protein B5X24_HaOG209210 [Helicoverpa armigera]|nr:hypothetical protein B5X24_HaOG209210 [Helicoverpa armigera]
MNNYLCCDVDLCLIYDTLEILSLYANYMLVQTRSAVTSRYIQVYSDLGVRNASGYMATSSPLPGEVNLRESINSAILPPFAANSPLVNMADRLVMDALRRTSLTRRPSSIKYPPNYFSSPTEESSSSSEEETKKKRGKKKKDKV